MTSTRSATDTTRTTVPPPPADRSTTRRSKTLLEMWPQLARSATTKKPTDFVALRSRLGSIKAAVAKPELDDAPSAFYSRPDVVVTEQTMLAYLQKNGSKFDNMHVLFEPAGWWDAVYYDCPAKYYNLRYGANSSHTIGLVCQRCNNKRCPKSDETLADAESIATTGVCLNCTRSSKKCPLTERRLEAAAIAAAERAKPRKTCLVTRQEIRAQRLRV